MYVAELHPLVKAAISSSGIVDFAKVTILRAFKKEPRLLAQVDRIAQQRMNA